MNVITKTRFEVVPLTRHIGAEIRGIDLARRSPTRRPPGDLPGLARPSGHRLSRQTLSQEDLLRVTGYFGEIGEISRPAKYFPKGYAKLLPGIMLISNIRENGEPIGALPDGEMMFHHDMLHAELPHKGTCLYSVEVPVDRRQYALRQLLHRLRHADRRRSRPARRPPAFHHYNYGSVQKGDGKGTDAFAEACIRCSAPTRRPAARRSMSTG